MAGFLDALDGLFSNPQVWNAIGTGLQFAGRMQTAGQQEQYGAAMRQAAEFTAAQLREQANGALASAQRQAWSEERSTRYLMSETLARAAASGGGASDPTVINILAQQAEEGSYRQQVALYEGSERAHLLRMQATAREYEGAGQEASARGAAGASRLGAVSSLVGGMVRDASLFQRFGGGGPQQFVESDQDY